MTTHFYCVIRISLHSIQSNVKEINARNESERFTRKVSDSELATTLGDMPKPDTNILKKLHD